MTTNITTYTQYTIHVFKSDRLSNGSRLTNDYSLMLSPNDRYNGITANFI